MIRLPPISTLTDTLFPYTTLYRSLHIPNLAFDSVITTLEEAGMVSDVRRQGHRIASFSETVPFYSDLYPRPGNVWRSAGPTELEQQVVLLVDGLAKAPLARDAVRSEERRLGKEGVSPCSSRWWPYKLKQTKHDS